MRKQSSKTFKHEIVFCPNKSAARERHAGTWTWSCKKHTQLGDLYIFYFGDPIFQIGGVGICCETPDPEGEIHDGSWNWGERGNRYWFGKFRAVPLQRPVAKERIANDPRLERWWSGRPYRGGPKLMPAEAASHLLGILTQNNPTAAKLVNVQRGAADTDAELHGPFEDDPNPPQRVKYLTVRTVRSTPKGDELKRRYEHVCQACGIQTEVPGSMYSEVHHVRPLGRKHRGLDNHDNMLVLCPLCHVLFDYCALAIDPKTGRLESLRRGNLSKKRCTFQPDHRISAKNLSYHWQRFQKLSKQFHM